VTGRFDFSWSGLGDGVWAVASDRTNFVGKSTILEVLLWSLRGDVKSLQADIRKWLEHVRTDFTLDDDAYAVDFDVVNGVPAGKLVRVLADGSVDEKDAFATHAGFASAMSDFMMEALDLDPIPFQLGKDEAARVAEHGWKALSGGLLFWGEHQRLLGETDFGGLPGRILQLYVGMPWAATVMQASAALKDLGTEELRAKAVHRTASDVSAKAIAEIQGDLDSARERLSERADDTDFAKRIDDLASAVVEATASYNEIERRLVAAENEAQELRAAADADEREARGIRETFVASSFFNGLQPTCCPRCEAAVTKDRIKRELTDFNCSVCTEPLPDEKMEDVNERLAEAEERASATRAASDRAAASVSSLSGQASAARDDLKRAREELGAAPASSGLRQRRDIELEIARLEGMLKAHSESVPAPAAAPDRQIVASAYELAKTAMDAAAKSLLSELDDEVLKLAQRFGFVSLESVAVDAQARMSLHKGGASAVFGDVTKGERLRLRIATAIALLRIGKKLGVGRHPGLLVIDSPGADETDDSNLEALLKELRSIAETEVGLQVFVSSAKANEVVTLLNPGNCRVAAKGEYLW
ncbi:MAG: hypothetical protein J0I67_07215, partial [Bosea sp.]|nr:hypothetical protein [Bosea sp. (in: a-proteobacteria)]